MENLKTKTARGMFWSYFDSFGVYLIKFIFSIIIARTLSPSDYGLMGMIVIFIAIGQVLMQSGFSMALVQKKDTDAADLSTAFWFNVIVGLIFYFILFFSAHAIAGFFDKTILVNLTRVAAAGIVINSLCSVQVAVLTKKMDFRTLTWINMTSALISGSTGLVLALKGYEVWALVFQTLSGNLIYLLGLWIVGHWRPQLIFNIQSFRSLFNFGYKVMFQGLADVVFTKAFFPLIGRFYPVAQLGYFTNASRFDELFIRKTSFSFNRVIFPAFSKIQDDKERFSNNYLRLFNLLTVMMFLASLLLIICSRPFIEIALTAKWLPSVPFMQLLFVEGFFFPVLMFNHNVLLSTGRSGISLRIDILNKSLLLLSIIFLVRVGIRALIIGQLTATAVSFIISVIYIIRMQKINIRHILFPLLKLYLVIAGCFLLSHYVIRPLSGSNILELLLNCTLVPLVFFIIASVLGLNAFSELKILFKDYVLRPARQQK